MYNAVWKETRFKFHVIGYDLGQTFISSSGTSFLMCRSRMGASVVVVAGQLGGAGLPFIVERRITQPSVPRGLLALAAAALFSIRLHCSRCSFRSQSTLALTTA